MRKKIFEIIGNVQEENKLNNIYNFFMMIVILVSIIPLAFKESNVFFKWIEYISVVIFILDYILRLITADFKLKKSWLSFIIYPFTPLAIIDILSILPSVTVLNNSLKLLKLFRLLRCLKVLRTFKFLRYSKSFEIIIRVFKKQKKVLKAVVILAISYIFISALVIYNIEQNSFESFFDAVYWATISLTTVGYGDIYPVTVVGKLFSMLSSILGIAIIALPAGVITAGYMNEINEIDNDK